MAGWLSYPFLIWVVPFLCLLTRIVMTWRQNTNFDSWGHLFFTISTKREKCGPFGPIHPKLAATGAFYYPLLVHWLLGFLPERILLHANRLINPVVEALFLGLFIGLAKLGGVDLTTIGLASALYIFTPLIFSKVSIGPNVSQFTTRIYSELLLTLFFLLAYLDIGLAWPVQLVLCALIITTIVLSSKFGVQAVLLLGIPAALVTLNLLVFAALLGGFLIAIMISGGHFLKMLKSQGAHLKWYLKSLKTGTAFVSHRYDPRVIFQGLKGEPKKIMVQKFILNIVGKNSYSALLIKTPLIIGFIILAVIGGAAAASPFEDMTSLIWVSLAVFCLINTKWFILLGEAERYVSHIFFIVVLVVASHLMAHELMGLAYALIAYGIVYWVFEFIVFGVFKMGVVQGEEDALLALAKGLPDDTVIAARPYHWFSPYQILAETNHRTIFPILANEDDAKDLQALEVYPNIKLDKLDVLHERYGLSVVFIETARLSEDEQRITNNASWHRVPYSETPRTTVIVHDSFKHIAFDFLNIKED